DENGCTPLYVAARQGSVEVVKMLLQRPGLDVNAADRWGRTPLLAAIRNGHQDVIVLLMLHPNTTDVDRPDKDGYTPLAEAIRSGHDDVVEYLLARNDVSLKAHNHLDMSVLHLA
ncbi:ankyrin, partial [Amniculicola lignicola CBS 123094]